ncbi:threonine-phosphate decarboxylase CobD [Pseudomonas sp. MYb185]|uniref:threonine-phosphate decarboxylase CobD n=1 Tax=Pseudomonas sp. MYb185 TaxID=1848729 RepID=UPI000CFAFEE0|nr:threonine-phosphate decarboxylase CobD [Pseudomonas sp. MYb185]PRB81328.1 threonine-phosphate decarboxylase [Pseudomonas sp. MYb185]
MLEHGGRLLEAATRFGIPPQQWLDLSTGLAPWPWPLPAIPASAWMRLPEPDDGLESIACAYYGASAVLPVAGSQAAIQALPRLRAPCRVAIIGPCYAEHQHAWQSQGHQVQSLTAEQLSAVLDEQPAAPVFDVVVLVNPDNPTGRVLDRATLLDWHARLFASGGWLVIDEAFADAQPACSLADCADQAGLIVLRSVGKFFGLAGIRLGFVLAEPALLSALEALLGPWAVSGPARAVGRSILADSSLQQAWRLRLQEDAVRLQELLIRCGLSPAGGCELFQWVTAIDVAGVYQQMVERGILLRWYRQPAGLRIGLPANQAQWQRLEQAFSDVMRTMGSSRA